MAGTLNTPDVLTQPIATNGTKNSIPNTNDQSLGLMSQSTGFPAICSERIADGGKAPRRADFNGAFNLLSQHNFFAQNGGTETFRQDVSDAIGGYPINSRLWFTNSNGESVIVRSLIQNNTYNFNNDPSYIDGIKWVVDVESGAPVGSLMPYAGTTPPDGWLICDGSEISRTTYARLFSVIGTTYGAGDGNSSFNLPAFEQPAQVVESHLDANNDWWRIYTDGWCEQGGVVQTLTNNTDYQVNFHKELLYGGNISFSQFFNPSYIYEQRHVVGRVDNITKSKFVVRNARFGGSTSAGVSMFWNACGYLNNAADKPATSNIKYIIKY